MEQPAGSNKTLFIIFGVILGVVLLLLACGIGGFYFLIRGISKVRDAADEAQMTNQLKAITLAAISFAERDKEQGPRDVDDLATELNVPEILDKIRARQIDVDWSAMRDPNVMKAIRLQRVYCWHVAASPRGKRYVGLCDGSIRELTEAEFQHHRAKMEKK